MTLLSPDHSVRAHYELRLGVPLVIGDVVMSLQPNPLLTFGEEPVIAGLSLPKLHHCNTTQTHDRQGSAITTEPSQHKRTHSRMRLCPPQCARSFEGSGMSSGLLINDP